MVYSDHYEECCEEIYPREHDDNQNKECVEALIDALYNDEKELNTDFIAEQLFLLAQDYGIIFDDRQKLNIQKKQPKKSEIFAFAADLSRSVAEQVQKGGF